MKNYKAVIFDLDGTLLDTKQDIAATANHTLTCLGAQPLPQEEIYKYVGYGIKNLVLKSLPDQSPQTIEKGIQLFTDYYYNHCVDHTQFYPDAIELIQNLKRSKIKIAVLTNKPHFFTMRILHELKVVEWFDFILGAEHGFPLKPDTTTTLHLLEALQVLPEDALMVGDTSVDLHLAKNVNMDCALMSQGYGTHDDLTPVRGFAIGVFENFSELRSYLGYTK